MNKFNPFLPIIPLVAAAFFLINAYILFLTYIQPKYVVLFGASKNPLNDAHLYSNYPIYFMISMAFIAFLFLFIIFLALKKPNYNYVLFLLIFSLISIYLVNLNATVSGGLMYKVLFDTLQKDHDAFVDKVRLMYNK